MKNAFFFFLSVSLFAACSGGGTPDSPLNDPASLPAGFHFGQKGLKVLTSSFNRNTRQVAMLFGNAKARQLALSATADSSGAEWDLVTWNIVADRHWFGAEIPGELVSVETLTKNPAAGGRAGFRYTRFAGKDLTPDPSAPDPSRIPFIMSMQPAIMP